MITFRTVRWKNFLSTGNAFTELQLDKAPTTLVVGENGSGKSTMLDAICFALFGRPFRKINKPQLLNTINSKACVVEIEFEIGGKSYKVIRGMRPGIFEIYQDGNLLNQDAAARDYQKYLEESILRLNYRSFTQIVILGSASFTPFMQLTLGQRREIIEDILDIQIFTVMNQVLKDKLQDMKTRLQDVETDLKLAVGKAKMQEDYIKTLQADHTERLDEIGRKIAETEEHIKVTEAHILTLTLQKDVLLSEIADLSEVMKDRNSNQSEQLSHGSAIEILEKEIAFYEQNLECPTCKQEIDDDFRIETLNSKQAGLCTHRSAVESLEALNKALIARLSEINTVRAEVARLDADTNGENAKIIADQRFVQTLILEQHDLQTKGGNITTEKAKLKDLAKGVVAASKRRTALNEERHFLEIAGSLLKDSGIKTKIIRKYLPAINKLVNKYLQSMDFFVQFTLDEQFNESIKSRHRDDFSYESFSEGEKQRIDLALVFTWRTIAKLKNSASTNLLLLDEVFDSSLDNNGTDYVMSLLNTLGEDTNVWVISHKGDQLFDKFHQVLRFEKKQNFSVLTS
jgi:DNA repair exonuclease SbcCD ATPase subunit